MFEMLLLSLCTLPIGLWLASELLVSGLNRDPIAFSVLEMLALAVSVGMVVWTIGLVRSYKETENEGRGYIISYGLLIFIGSLFTSVILLSNFLAIFPDYYDLLFWIVGLIFTCIPCLGVLRVWRALR